MRDAIAAAGTGTAGLAQILEMIPDNIGKLACLMGIILTFHIIVEKIYNIREKRMDLNRKEQELKYMEKENNKK